MKRLLSIILLLVINKIAFSRNFYFSIADGNNTRSATLAQNPNTPWQTILKLDSIFSTLLAGDSVLFKRGEIFTGTIKVAKNGDPGNPIIIGAYGTAPANPIISGFTTVGGWTSSGNIWTSAVIPGTNTKISMVTFSDVATGMGRWPNAGTANGGYASYNVGTPLSSIVSLTAMPFDFTNGTLCQRKIADILGRERITSVSGSTINYTNLTGSQYPGFAGFGYFVENLLATLDVQNEWFFNEPTRRLSVYSTTMPTNVKISTTDTLLFIGQYDNITVCNLTFQGADKAAISLGGPTVGVSNNTIIKNCNFDNSGRDAISATANGNTQILNNYINHSMNNAIYLESEGGKSINTIIKFNTIKNTGAIPGLHFVDYTANYNSLMEAITNVSNAAAGELGMTVKFNYIDTVGHVGVRFYQNNTFVDSNYIHYFCFVTDDAGAINTFDNFTGVIETNRTIIGNIIENGPGAALGAGGAVVNGIYVDDKADGVLIQRNSVGNIAGGTFDGSAIYIHNGTNLVIRDNTCYNGGYSGLGFVHDNHAIGMPIRNVAVKNNLVFAKLNTSNFIIIRTYRKDVDSIFNRIDSNYYCRPTLTSGNNFLTRTNYQNSPDQNQSYTLTSWKSMFATALNGAYDPNSTSMGSNTNPSQFVFNETSSPKVINFAGFKKIDPYGTNYSNSITLAPYSSAILIDNGVSNQMPNVNAGIDKLITLPTNTTSLTATASDPDGTISSYLWSKLSGPGAGTISSPASATTNLTGLVQGVYQFQILVTDNLGGTDKDTVQVTVNTPPVASAGSDVNISLPTNTVTLNGAGSTDADGSITTYLWTKLSGPSGSSLVTPNQVSTIVGNLTGGVFRFELTVTDNNGAVDKDTVQIIVNTPPNANAGADITVNLPATTTTLTGTGSDIDGTISSYLWTKVSGPSGGTITSPSSASTGITALVGGVYKYKLLVTDNTGSTGVDTVQVFVNIPPVANAGADIVINLPITATTLNGGGTDADGTIVGYLWQKISGPSSFNILSPGTATTNINSLVGSTYQFELTVSDNNGSTGKDTVQIKVNNRPVVNAGVDILLQMPASTTTLNGSATDADGSVSSYTWSKIAGPAGGAITSTNTASTGITSLNQGTYRYQLSVIDNNGAIGLDTIQIVVNKQPVANAGADKLVQLPTNSVSVTGTATDDDGTIATYGWSYISGPGGSSIATPNSATTNINNLVSGTYRFKLTVTDNLGGIGLDTIQIVVNTQPVANAGSDITVVSPSTSATLNGSATDADGTIVSYTWVKISGTTGGTITSPNSASTGVTGLNLGVYKYELTVMDNLGGIGKDTVQVITNMPPTANAGSDIVVNSPATTTTLNGSGSDIDGTVASYNWSYISGPGGSSITTPNTALTGLTALTAGTYLFKLTVTDNTGGVGLDTVQVIVNVPPVANAGTNISISLPATSTTLNGSGTDADGTVVSYSWQKLTGPAGDVIATPNSATTGLSNLSSGVYTYELTVVDNYGLSDKDTVQVTLSQLPTANAGVDQLLIAPTNSTTLSGAGTAPSGSITSYAWVFVSGPVTGTIVSPTSATSALNSLSANGVYLYELTVTDNIGATAKDTVQIVVNTTPEARAGSDVLMSLPTNSTTLNGGTSSDADGSIAGYQWNYVSGPPNWNLVAPNNASTVLNGLTAGDYKFRLTVVDNYGTSSSDTLNVAVNTPPTVFAGNDRMITLPRDTVTVFGSVSDIDGTATVVWTQIGGPVTATINTPNSAITVISALNTAGIYTFMITATDDDGAVTTDTNQIIVNPASTPGYIILNSTTIIK